MASLLVASVCYGCCCTKNIFGLLVWLPQILRCDASCGGRSGVVVVAVVEGVCVCIGRCGVSKQKSCSLKMRKGVRRSEQNS